MSNKSLDCELQKLWLPGTCIFASEFTQNSVLPIVHSLFGNMNLDFFQLFGTAVLANPLIRLGSQLRNALGYGSMNFPKDNNSRVRGVFISFGIVSTPRLLGSEHKVHNSVICVHNCPSASVFLR